MRFALFLVFITLLICLIGHAAIKGTGLPMFSGAPQIQAKVLQNAEAELRTVTAFPAQAVADGRDVVVSGFAQSDADRDAAIAAVRRVALGRNVSSRIEVLREISPYEITASKTAEGAWRISGYVPSEEARAAFLAEATRLGAIDSVVDDLAIGTGVPEGDWTGTVSAGLAALSDLEVGTFTLTDMEGRLDGEVATVAARKRLEAVLAAVPDATWTSEISGAGAALPPSTLNALKTADGALIVSGQVPSREIKVRVVEVIANSGVALAGETIEIANTEPIEDWSETYAGAFAALGLMDEGLLNIAGTGVTLTGEVEGDDEFEQLSALMPQGWSTEITVRNPTPLAEIKLTLLADGTINGAGSLPKGLTPASLAAMLPGLSSEGFSNASPGKAIDWAPPMAGLNNVLPQFRNADITLRHNQLRIDGTLQRGFDPGGLDAELRTVLGSDWGLTLNVKAAPPPSEIILSKQDERIGLSGVLPAGLDPDGALIMFGDKAEAEALTDGGDGNTDDWRTNLTVLARAMPLFEELSGSMSEGKLALNGTLRPGYEQGAVADWLTENLAEAWSAEVEADAIAPVPGDTRRNLVTGETEAFSSGYWLAKLEFDVSSATCEREITRALDGGKINFVVASARLDQSANTLLDRLSAVASRCLSSERLQLEIAGHTDSVGNDAANMRLSERRAAVVKDALEKRGVNAEAMTAVGYGEEQPIATNNTSDGRAENRRITFNWSARGG